MLCVATNDAEVALQTRLYTFMRARGGVASLEYGLIVALIAGVLVEIVTHFGTGLAALFPLAAPVVTSG
jgi:Flp pilus assembly pilin Flp